MIWIRFFLFHLLLFACNLLPARFNYWIALRLGDLGFFLLDRQGRAAVMSNLSHVFPDATRQRIRYETRWVFRNFSKYLTEFFRFRQFDREFFGRHVSYRGLEHVQGMLDNGKGCLITSAHISNWELGGAGMANEFPGRVNVVAAMHANLQINRLFLRERESRGVRVLDMEKAPRQVIRALKENEIVCILGDRDPTGQGVEVSFFGKTCRFPQGPARFALQMGTGMIPGFVLRRTNDSFVVCFHPPIHPPEDGTKDEKVKVMMQQFANQMESVIREHPEEWGVFYRVWEEAWTS